MSGLMVKRRTSTFKGDVFRLVSGTGIAQVITVLSAPFITRLYTPEDFGIAALFGSLAAIVSVLACLRYEMSIILPEEDSEAANLLMLSLVFSLLTASIIAILFIFLEGDILTLAGFSELAPFIWLLPIVIMVHGVTSALAQWNTRTRHFTRISISRVIASTAHVSTSLGAGYVGHATSGALIAAGIGGQTLATSILGMQIGRQDGRFILNNLGWRQMWTGLKRYRRFPLYNSWATLLNTASWQLPVFLLGIFFSPAIAGFYALGFRLIQTPMSLIGSAIAQVFRQRGADARQVDKIAVLVESLFERLLIIGLLPSLILIMLGQELFAFFFGKDWAEAGLYAQILTPWALLWFISSPLGSVYTILEKQKEELGMQGFIFVSRLAALVLGGLFGSATLTITFLMFAGILSYGNFLYRVFVYSEVGWRRQIMRFVKVLLSTFPIVLFLLAAKYGAHVSDLSLLISAFIGICLYYFYHRQVMLTIHFRY